MLDRVLTPAIAVGVLLVCSGAAQAGTEFSGASAPACGIQPSPDRPWMVSFRAAGESAASASPDESAAITVSFATDETAGQDGQARQRVKPFEYSDGYKTRAKIHKTASIATLPLFIGEYFVGQSLYTSTTRSSGTKTAHAVLAGSIAGLFGVNTVTGVWNMVEASKDPNHKTIRTIHGILMLIADAGIVATAASPSGGGHEHGQVPTIGNNSTHRALAISSMGIATFSYLLMLVGGR